MRVEQQSLDVWFKIISKLSLNDMVSCRLVSKQLKDYVDASLKSLTHLRMQRIQRDSDTAYHLKGNSYKVHLPSEMDQLTKLHYVEEGAFKSPLYEELLMKSTSPKSIIYNGIIDVEVLQKSFQFFHSMPQLAKVEIYAKLDQSAVVDIFVAPHIPSFRLWLNIPSRMLKAVSSSLRTLCLSTCIDFDFDFPNLEELSFRVNGDTSIHVLDSVAKCSKLRCLDLAIELENPPPASTIQSMVHQAHNTIQFETLNIIPYYSHHRDYLRKIEGCVIIEPRKSNLARKFYFKLPMSVIFYLRNIFHKLTIGERYVCFENETEEICYAFHVEVDLNLEIESNMDRLVHVMFRNSYDLRDFPADFLSQLKHFNKVKSRIRNRIK